jgi:hypothetical protein
MSSSDPVQLYKGYWNMFCAPNGTGRTDEADDDFRGSRSGREPWTARSATQWKKGSGDERWDDSVRQVFNAATTSMTGRRPPIFRRA